MTKNQSMFILIAGLLLTFGAVGGIELAESSEQFLSSAVLAILGLLSMYAGVLGLRNSEFYDR